MGDMSCTGDRYVTSGRSMSYRGQVCYVWEIYSIQGMGVIPLGDLSEWTGFVTSRGSVRYRGWVGYVREIC